MEKTNYKLKMANDYITIANGFKKIANKYRSIIDLDKKYCTECAELYDYISERFYDISASNMRVK